MAPAAKGTYSNLIVWQKAMDLVDAVFDVTDLYPKEHLYGLTAHTRKTAISIPSNIAEGRRRGSDQDFRRFLLIAYGSGGELETQLLIAQRRPFGKDLDFARCNQLLDEVMRILNTMINK